MPAGRRSFSAEHNIRVLYVITDLKLGGVPLHLLRLTCAMREQGLEPAIVALSPPGPVSEMLAERKIATLHLGAHGPWDWRVLERLAQVVADRQPDLVHAFLFHANIAARAACLLGGYPTRRLICEIQTVEIERPWHLRVDRWTQRGCRAIVGNSPSVIEHLRSTGGIHPARLRLVRGGIDPAPIRAADPISRAALGVPAEGPLLLWVGRLDPVKGLDELIDAFVLVSAQRTCHLVLVGEGAYRTEVEARIMNCGRGDRIHLLGARADVPRCLKAADVFVFPSRTEGMPNALLEAMAAGLPCIASDVPGCRDVITDPVNGLLAPPRAPSALAAVIERLLTDAALARRLGLAAAQTVESDFHIAATHRAYRELYDELTASTPSKPPDAPATDRVGDPPTGGR